MAGVDKIILILIIAFSCGCDSRPSEKVFDLLYQNKFDSASMFFNNSELDFIFDKNLYFERKYTYAVTESEFTIFEVDGKSIDPDTIQFSWDKEEETVKLDDQGLVKMLSRETAMVVQLAVFNKSLNKTNRANDWLIQTEDSELNYTIGKAFYDIYERDFAYPYLKKAYDAGNQNSGLILSDLYTFSGNRDRGVQMLKGLAKLKNSEAMVKLGEIYDTYSSVLGYVAPEDADNTSSFEWYKKGAQLNNPIAMQRLGYIYQAGINRAENLDSAIYWYKKSSILGEPSATVELALVSLRSQDIKAGFKFMDKAVEQNLELGLFEYGKIYEYGIGVKVDKDLALKYYKKADSLGSPVAYLRINILEKDIHRM